jgi:hypothetical protein
MGVEFKRTMGKIEMSEILVMLGIVVFWIALQVWILPRWGVQT